MRITSGHLGGRAFSAPPGHVRPTQDRVRQSLFSSLGGRMDGWRVADLFAGSGSFGLEAWSRGAETVLWVERDPNVFSHLRQTVATLCPGAADRAVCRRADVLRWGWADPDGAPFDLVFADPPYAVARETAETVLCELSRRGMIRVGGWAVMEMGSSDESPRPAGWERIRDREMGGTRIATYRRSDPTGAERSPDRM